MEDNGENPTGEFQEEKRETVKEEEHVGVENKVEGKELELAMKASGENNGCGLKSDGEGAGRALEDKSDGTGEEQSQSPEVVKDEALHEPCLPSLPLSDADYEGLTRLAMHLYCLPYTEEFRQPVHLKYPDLFETYLTTIKNPSDLGTILIKLKNKSYSSADECRRDLILCFKNAIQFNEDLTNLVSISNHLLSFAENMWHEIMKTPFYTPNKETNTLSFDFKVSNRRKVRFDTVHYQPMLIDEVQYFLNRLNAMPLLDSPFYNTKAAMISKCENAMNSVDDNKKITLFDLVCPLLESLKQCCESSELVSADDMRFPCYAKFVLPSKKFSKAIDSQKDNFLNALERVLGEISSILFERLTRGFDVSSIWIRYSRVVWAQPNCNQLSKGASKRASWWPGVVIGGDGVSRVLEDINVSRIPKSLKSALYKLRPKSKDCASVNGGFVGTDQLCLVEYFGTHDFGWCKTELMIPYEKGGKFVLPEDKREAGYIDKVTQDATALEEAENSFENLQTALKATNIVPETDFLDKLEVKVANLRTFVRHVLPPPDENKKRGHSAEEKDVVPKKSNKRKKSSEASDFSFTMYPSEIDDLSKPGNKRHFALMKTKSLCHYGQQQSRLTVSVSRRGGHQASAQAKKKTNSSNEKYLIVNDLEGVDSAAHSAGVGVKLDMESVTQAPKANKKKSSKKADNTISEGTCEDKKDAPRYTPKVLTFAGQSFAAAVGCTQVIRNKAQSFVPVLHTRKVVHNAPVFFLEAPSCSERKSFLREEISRLKGELENMSDWLKFADEINARRQRDKIIRAVHDKNSGGKGPKSEGAKEKKEKKEKGGYKKRLLAGKGSGNKRKSSEVAAEGTTAKRKYVKKAQLSGESRGKAQEGSSDIASVMTSRYQPPKSEEASIPAKVEVTAKSVDGCNSVEEGKPASDGAEGDTNVSKPYSGFTSAMNMMPSV